MAKKASRRQPKIKQPRRKKLWLFLFIGILLVGGIYCVLSLPIWEIKQVVVNGAKMLSADEIRAMAGVPLSDNLFFSDLRHARDNLKKINAIKSFRFYRLPPSTILISLKERRPMATIVLEQKSVLIDDEGVILNRSENLSLNVPNLVELPVISGVDKKAVIGSERLDQEMVEVVSNIILKLAEFGQSSRIQIELGKMKDVSFLVDDLLRVKLGDTSRIKLKMEIFESLLPVVAGRWVNVDYVDIRYPDNPVIKYK